MAKKQKLPMFISPKGVGQYPYLLRYDDRFDADGVFSVKLILDADEDSEYLESLTAAAQEAYDNAIKELKAAKKVKQAKELEMHIPFSEQYDDEGQETGKVIVNFKMKAKVTPKNGDEFTQKPDVFDAGKKPVAADTRIGSGSIMKIAYNVIPYYNAATKSAGVSLRLKAAMILELVEYGTSDADSYGFDDEEGSFHSEGGASAFDEDSDEAGDDGHGDF